MLTSIEIMETTKKFRVPTVEEMDEAAELMRKDAPTSHFTSNKLQAGSTSGENVTPTPSEAVIPSSSSSSHPLAALKKSAFYDQVQDEFRTMIQNELTTKVESSTSNAPKAIPTIITNKIVVNPRQRGNPVLKGICNVPWEFGDIVPDYVMGRTTCALFLSLRYHSLNPDYIQDRIKQLGNNYELRVLLVQVDVKDCQHALNQLMKISILMNMTLILAWSPEEAGRHLETYKIFQHKPPDIIMKKQDSNNCSKVIDALTSVKSINRSDAVVLLDNFKTLEGIINASIEQLSFCPGIGTQKAKRLYSVLHENFLKPGFK